MRIVMVLAMTSFLVGMSSSASAQQTAPGPGPDVRIAPAVGYQGGVFGDDSPKSNDGAGFSIGAQVRGQTHRRTGFSFEAALQPIGIRNPHFDETLHTAYFLIGPEIGRRTYVRPAGGVALQMWSGTRAESGLDLALAFGLAIGHRRTMGNRDVGFEFVAKSSCSIGACSALLGLQVPVNMGTK
jgi:hypothetical protein